MNDLQKEFEATGYTSWINSQTYPDVRIYTKEYTEWLEKQVLALRQLPVIKSVCEHKSAKWETVKWCDKCTKIIKKYG